MALYDYEPYPLRVEEARAESRGSFVTAPASRGAGSTPSITLSEQPRTPWHLQTQERTMH